ncbi:MAG: hypothetical protein ACKVW3_11785 [Phycisphaerales bacterium]
MAKWIAAVTHHLRRVSQPVKGGVFRGVDPSTSPPGKPGGGGGGPTPPAPTFGHALPTAPGGPMPTIGPSINTTFFAPVPPSATAWAAYAALASAGSITNPPPEPVYFTSDTDGPGATFTDSFNNRCVDFYWASWLGTWLEAGHIMSASGAGYLAYLSQSYTDCIVEATASGDDWNGGVFARGSRDALGRFSGYVAYSLEGTVSISRIDIDVETPLVSEVPASVSSGDALGIDVDGTTIRVTVNGSAQGTAIDATYASGLAGLYSRNGGGYYAVSITAQ